MFLSQIKKSYVDLFIKTNLLQKKKQKTADWWTFILTAGCWKYILRMRNIILEK